MTNNFYKLPTNLKDKKELHPSWNTGKKVYLYQIVEDKLILRETFINTSRAHETFGISRTTLWKYLNTNTIIFSNIKTSKKKDSNFLIGKFKNPLYVGKFIVSLYDINSN